MASASCLGRRKAGTYMSSLEPSSSMTGSLDFQGGRVGGGAVCVGAETYVVGDEDSGGAGVLGVSYLVVCVLCTNG